jgi:hypothetical protein
LRTKWWEKVLITIRSRHNCYQQLNSQVNVWLHHQLGNSFISLRLLFFYILCKHVHGAESFEGWRMSEKRHLFSFEASEKPLCNNKKKKKSNYTFFLCMPLINFICSSLSYVADKWSSTSGVAAKLFIVRYVVGTCASIINVSHVRTMKLEQIKLRATKGEILIMKLNNETLEISPRLSESLEWEWKIQLNAACLSL